MFVTSKLKHFVLYVDGNVLQKETERKIMSLLTPIKREVTSYISNSAHVAIVNTYIQ